MNRAFVLLAMAVSVSALAGCPSRVNTANDIVVGKAPASPEDPAALETIVPGASPSPTEPAMDAEAEGPIYLLRDTGKRCFAAPCPSWAAVDVETRKETAITGVDVSRLGLDPKAADDARRRILGGQIWVRGDIEVVPKQGPAGDGTVLFVRALVEAHEVPAK